MRGGKKIFHSSNIPAVRTNLNSMMTFLSSPRLPFSPPYHSSDVQARRSPSTQAATSRQLHKSSTFAYPCTPIHTCTHALVLSQPAAAYIYKHTLGFFVSATDNRRTNHWQQYKAPCVPRAGTHAAALTAPSSARHHSQTPRQKIRPLMP